MRARQAADIARVLDHRDLHAETDAEIRNVVLARIARRHDLAFNAALTEAARPEDRVHALQDARRFGFDRFGFYVAYLDARAGLQTGVTQRFIPRLVRLGQIYVLSANRPTYSPIRL